MAGVPRRVVLSLRDILGRLKPEAATAPPEWLWSAASALVAALVVLAVSGGTLAASPPLLAAVGATSALVFALPMSPLAQPWAVIGGYLVSAIAGLAAARWIPGVPLAGAVAVGGAVFGMLALRCLHPPGGAVALHAVIGGPEVQALGLGYIVSPVLLDALLLVAIALVVNNIQRDRHYPRRPVAAHAHLGGLTEDDLKEALREYGHPLAASEEELDAILSLAERRARARQGP